MAEKRSNEISAEATSIAKKIKSDVVATTPLAEESESLEQTVAPSTLPKNDAVSDWELPHLDYYEIVWLNCDVENPIKFDRLRTISDYVIFFDNVDNCREYIEIAVTASDRSSIFLVTFDHLAEKLVPAVYHLNQISSIHCLTKDAPKEEWMSKDPKIKVHTALQPLLKSLLNDVHQYSKNHENQNIFDLGSSSTKQDNTTNDVESWWPKLFNILVHLPYPQDCFQRFITTMRKYYVKNPPELRNIDELERNYLSPTDKNPIREYTKGTFLYRLVNCTLRQQNIQVIFLFGFFLRDLYQQLKCEHEKFLQTQLKDTRVTVYRGQIMSKIEVEKLTKSIDRVVTNSFLSTTADPAISEVYLGTSKPEDELQSILFEIELNLAEKSFPYADISTISWFPSESEILLMPGLEFTMTENSIYYDVDRKIWLAKLKLIWDTIKKDDDRILEGFSERRTMRNYIALLIETLTDFCRATTDHTQAVFNELMELFPTEKWILAVKMSCLANYNIDSDLNYTLALKNYDEALKIWIEFKNDDELNAHIDIGQIYYEIGDIYYYYLEDFRKARENFDLSINYYQIAIDKGLTSSEKIKIYELLHNMYAKKLAITVKDKDNDINEEEEKENRSIFLKYLELHLESMLQCYTLNDKRITEAVEELSNYFDQFEMYDEELRVSKRFLELYQQDDAVANSENIVGLLKKIIAIYLLYKNDHESAVIYQSILEEHIAEEDTAAVDDFIIDYRQSEEEEVQFADVVPPRRRWSTID